MNNQIVRAIARYRRPFLAVLMVLITTLFVSSASATTGFWTLTGELNVPDHLEPTATLLNDGRVLLAGGEPFTSALRSAELYDLSTGTWSTTVDMNFEHFRHTATLLENGKVLVAGGQPEGAGGIKEVELFDPSTAVWTPAEDMNYPRFSHTATLLTDGRVLVVGGYGGGDSSELFDPATGFWTLTAGLTINRAEHTATMLPDGHVLIAGGSSWPTAPDPFVQTILYDPVAETWIHSADMNLAREAHTATLLQDGRVLVTGGWSPSTNGTLKSAELYDPSTDTWTPTSDMHTKRRYHEATLLSDGRVLITGGNYFEPPSTWETLKSAELYDPIEGTWTLVADMHLLRSSHTATLLDNGLVLVAGGSDSLSTELFYICAKLPGNIIQNPCFEDGKYPWSFYTNGSGSFETIPIGYGGPFAARIKIYKPGSNVQLYQSSLDLEPNQEYHLYFAAKANRATKVSVYVHKHDYPYTNYGLYGKEFDLTPQWKQYQWDFTTNSQAAADGRLRFWLAPYDAAGDEYWFDNVYLLKVTDGVPPPPDPNPQPVEVPPFGHCSPPVAGNVIGNPGFEAGSISPWAFYTDGSAGRLLSSDRYECDQAFEAAIYKEGSNVQLYQAYLDLQPNTAYRLRLAAKSTDGRDVRLYLHKHRSPYTNYGLNGLTLDLTEEWQVFVVQFTTTGFTSPVYDGRLRIWLAEEDAPGAHYFFDDVVLTTLDDSTSAMTLATTGLDSLQSAGSFSKDSLTGAKATGKLLSSGFFIDDDDAGRGKGAFIPGSQRGGSRCELAQPSHAKLWPANGQMVKVKIVGAGKPIDLAISGIWQDEDVGAEADAAIDGQEAWLRAERDEGGNGRVYHIAFSATYNGGGTCEHEVLVTVPPAKGATSIDDGPLADSTKP